ncbi:Hypothetical protein HEAR0947 [Herminiimonas arsenicoxydans]|uniref:Uncharacterized protein n=1 Tax=Herminiimonas arsenicoxydans TaxID=204773 RepID=A4G3P3_HERAR|nr:Hypothetical protein HEAR0947 [Herminiimonas arsenicoxydans]
MQMGYEPCVYLTACDLNSCEMIADSMPPSSGISCVRTSLERLAFYWDNRMATASHLIKSKQKISLKKCIFYKLH